MVGVNLWMQSHFKLLNGYYSNYLYIPLHSHKITIGLICNLYYLLLKLIGKFDIGDPLSTIEIFVKLKTYKWGINLKGQLSLQIGKIVKTKS